jgi:putative DNA primase/helicase
MANLLAQVRRDGSTLSATIRNLFDGRDLEPLTKHNRIRASRPHVPILAHVTAFELRARATENDALNGLLNRFLFLYVWRERLVPLPIATPDDVVTEFAQRLAAIVHELTYGEVGLSDAVEIDFSSEARDQWVELYPSLSRDRDGRIGALSARAETYGRMLAMIFALLDGRRHIAPKDIRAALAWVSYANQSVHYIFNTPDLGDELDEFATAVLRFIRSRADGVTATDLCRHFKNNKNAKEIRQALETLLTAAPPLIV